jgi:peptide deformylase
MTIEPLPIVLYPDPFLNKVARPVTLEELKAGKAQDKSREWDLRELVERMRVTMYDARGIGLAAPQVGVGLRLFVYDISKDGDEFHEVFNPVLSEMAGTVVEEEGCLSIPEVRAKVKRAATLKLTGLNLSGEAVEVEADDLLARCFQHETDHLDGVLFINKLTVTSRLLIRRGLHALEDDYEMLQIKKKRAK